MFNTGVYICHPTSVAALPGMADAKQQLLRYLPPDDEQLCPPDCVLVSEDGTGLPAHQSFLFLNFKELGEMLAVPAPDDKGSRRLQVSCCVFATNACPPSSLPQCCVLLANTLSQRKEPGSVCRVDVLKSA